MSTLLMRLYSCGPFLGGRRARHGTIHGTGSGDDSHQRHDECGRASRRAGTNLGTMELRLFETAPSRSRPSAQAYPAHWDRRVVVKKKHRQFVAVIVDHDNKRVLEVLKNREKATVLAYLQNAKQGVLLAQVVEVTTDMWDAYVGVAREVFGEHVTVTIDRFHVMKNFQECLTAARRELQ